MGEVGVGLDLGQRGVANDGALHRLMSGQRIGALLVGLLVVEVLLRKAAAMFDGVDLGDADIVGAAGTGELASDGVLVVRCAQQVRVEADTRPDASGFSATSKAEMHRNRAVGMAGHHQRGSDDFASECLDLNCVVLLELEALHGSQAHQRGVVPTEVRDLLGQFLQPAHVGEAAVVERWIGAEGNLQCVCRQGNFGLGRNISNAVCALHRGRQRHRVIRCRKRYVGWSGLGREGSALDPSIVQRAAPARVEVSLDVGLRRCLHRVEDRGLGIVQQHLQHVVRAVSAIERRDHGLNDGDGSVVGARIGPTLQVMRLVDVPHAHRTRLVHMRAKMHGVGDLVERSLELQIGGRGVERVDAQHDKPLHLAGVHVADKRLEVCNLLSGHGVHRLGVDDRLADVAQPGIQRVSRDVNLPGSLLAGDDHALARVGLNIFLQ